MLEVFRRACPQEAPEQRFRAVAAAMDQGQWLSAVISQRALVPSHDIRRGRGMEPHTAHPLSPTEPVQEPVAETGPAALSVLARETPLVQR